MTSAILVVVVAAGLCTAIGILITYELLKKRLEVIHDLVNSNLTRVQADLLMAQKRIEVLEQHLVKLGR